MAGKRKNAADLQTYLNRNYPKSAAKLPPAVVGAGNTVWKGWFMLGPLRYLLIAGFMATIPILMEKDIIPYLQGGFGTNILFLTGIWILLALGLSVVVGMAGLLDLGYVAFFMLGAYATALMTDSGAADQFHFAIWPVWAVLPVAIIVAMLTGAALGVPTLRLRGDYLAIVTLGFHEIVRQTMNNLNDITNGSRGIFGIPHPDINIFGIQYEFGLDASPYWWFLLIPSIILAAIMIRHLDDSRVGRYWTAIREDEVAAAAMGVPVVKMKVLAFVIGASTSGLAGWIYAVKINFISPQNFPLLSSILVLSAVVVGGIGSVAGATLGAIIVITLPEVVRQASDGRAIFGFDVETGRIAVFGLMLIVVMIFRPGGLLAARRRRTELSEAGPDDAVVDTGGDGQDVVRSKGDDVHSPGSGGEEH
jgi:branched-chain amino acid transport system permease protein